MNLVHQLFTVNASKFMVYNMDRLGFLRSIRYRKSKVENDKAKIRRFKIYNKGLWRVLIRIS
jgi:hypothetical protein